MNNNKNGSGGERKYHGLLVHDNRGYFAAPDVQPLIGLVVAEMPQAVRGGRYMTLLTYGEEVTMVVLDLELGRQLVDLCRAAGLQNMGSTGSTAPR